MNDVNGIRQTLAKQPKEGWRVRNAYTITQAAKLAGTTPATVRRWLHGYSQPGHSMKPVFARSDDDSDSAAIVSFLQLAEIVVVAAFRAKGITLDRLRRAHLFAEERLGLSYPFATQNFKTDGAHVLHQFDKERAGPHSKSLLDQPDSDEVLVERDISAPLQTSQQLIALDMNGQWVMPWGVIETIDRFDFDRKWAVRWFPEGRDIPIVIDPRISAGKPTVVKKGVRVAMIYARFKAHESIDLIARDFGMQAAAVERILDSVQRYEERYAA